MLKKILLIAGITALILGSLYFYQRSQGKELIEINKEESQYISNLPLYNVNGTSFNSNITSLGKKWTITRYAGIEAQDFNLTTNFNATNGRTTFCAIPKVAGMRLRDYQNLSLKAWIKLGNAALQDVTNSVILNTTGGGANTIINSACLTTNTSVADYFKYGNNTIITEYQDQKRIDYQTDLFNMSAILYKNVSNVWDNTVNSVFVRSDSNTLKFGANDTGTASGEVNDYRYTIAISPQAEVKFLDSYQLLINENNDIWLLSLNDICLPSASFDPSCMIDISQNITITFKAKYNDALGYTLIDPTVSFMPGVALGPDITPLSSNSFVVGATSSVIENFSIFDTTGSRLAGSFIIPGSINLNRPVSFADLNKTAFVAFWANKTTTTSENFFYSLYDFSGNQLALFPIPQANNSGGTFAVNVITSTAALNNTALVFAWNTFNATTNNILKSITYDSNGNNLSSPINIDSVSGVTSSNTIVHRVAALSNNVYVVAWGNLASSTAKAETFYVNGTTKSGVITLGTSVVNLRIASVATLNNTAFVASWMAPCTTGNCPVNYRICDDLGNCGSTVQVETTEAGGANPASQFTDVIALNSTAFAVGFANGSQSLKIKTYDTAGNVLSTNSFVAGRSSSPSSPTLAMAGYLPQAQSICNGNFVFAWTDVVNQNNFTTYYPNGTIWNGTCSSVTPANTCTYTSGNWNVACSDNCSIITNVNINAGANITINGTGTFTLSNANITGYKNLNIYGFNSTLQCNVYLINNSNIR